MPGLFAAVFEAHLPRNDGAAMPTNPRRETSPSHARDNRAMFDRIADRYDRMNLMMTAGIDRRWRRRAVAMLDGADDGPILDLCAGTLDLSAMLEAARPDARIVAYDASAGMLEAGRAKVRRVETVRGDALALPFEDRSFAGAICGFGMRNLADLGRGIDEVRRVLRPGGVFVTLELFKPRSLAARLTHGAGLRFALPVFGAVVAKDRAAYGYLARSMDAFVTREAYQRTLLDHGFAAAAASDLAGGIASLVRATLSYDPEPRCEPSSSDPGSEGAQLRSSSRTPAST